MEVPVKNQGYGSSFHICFVLAWILRMHVWLSQVNPLAVNESSYLGLLLITLVHLPEKVLPTSNDL